MKNAIRPLIIILVITTILICLLVMHIVHLIWFLKPLDQRRWLLRWVGDPSIPSLFENIEWISTSDDWI